MDKFVIKGNNPLKGTVKVEGSKNSALPIILGALLIDKGETVIKNIPPLRDIYSAIDVLTYLGAEVDYDAKKETLKIDSSKLNKNKAPYELMRKMRASFLVLGPLISRLGVAHVSLPGGCSLGPRPVDFHIKAFKAMGAEIKEEGGYVIARAKKLNGGEVYFDRPSHTGTENVLYGAIFAKNKTTIINAACDPEIVDVSNFLNKAGAKIKGAGTPTIIVEPVIKLKAISYAVAGDRLVAGTYLIGAAVTGGEVKVTGIDPVELTMVSHKLKEMGCQIKTQKNSISVKAPKKLLATDMTTFPFPGFPTDLQACIMVAMSIASGTSHIKETVFKDRFVHIMEMRRLGADISESGGEAVIKGVSSLKGAQVMAPDIRAGAGLVLACLAAKGKSEILRIYHVDRGYSMLEKNLVMLGADIKREKE